VTDPLFATLQSIAAAVRGEATDPSRIRALSNEYESNVRAVSRRGCPPAVVAGALALVDRCRDAADALALGDVDGAVAIVGAALAGAVVDDVPELEVGR
jgi:hypothetical protein